MGINVCLGKYLDGWIFRWVALCKNLTVGGSIDR